jgi:uncharacterized membrane protein YgcG
MASLLLLLGAPLHKKTWFFGLLAAFLWTTAALAFPPRAGWVTDAAGVMKPEARQSLQRELDDYEKRTGFEVAAVVVATLEGKSVEDYSYELAKSWKVGKAGKDNGVILLLAMKERKSRIETGKGVGHLLTDVESADILDRAIKPRMKAGDVAGALLDGTRAIQRQLSPDAAVSEGDVPGIAASRGSSFLSTLAKLGGAVALLWVGYRLLVIRDRHRYARSQLRKALVDLEKVASELPPPEALLSSPGAGSLSPLERGVHDDFSRTHARAQADLVAFRKMWPSSASEVRERERSVQRSILEASQLARRFKDLHARGVDLRQGAAAAAIKKAQAALLDLRNRIAADPAIPLLESDLALLDEQDRQLAQASILDEKRNALDSAGAVLVALRDLEGRIQQRQICAQEAPGRIAELTRGLDTLEREVGRGSGAWKEFVAQFPREDAGPNPAALIFEARSLLGRLSKGCDPGSCAEIDAFLEAEEALRKVLKATREATEQALKLVAERKRRHTSANTIHERVVALAAKCSRLSLSSEGDRLVAQGEALRKSGKDELARREMGNTRIALDKLTQAEALFQDACNHLYTAPAFVSSSDSGSSGGYDGGSGSSYDSGSSYSGGSSYDSGSSSSYDSGSSGSSGGGDYGGGGSSSDW